MITVKDVEHVAKLARLSLTEEEKKLYTEQLSRILDYFSELDQVDTTGVEPMSHPVSATNVLRSDAVVNPPGHEKMLKTAPDKEDAFFRVPKISD
ncbi:MAG: Asp-tRNA(Asn)/Glu-tRNA(Gln) amidotransferase subunit GatC [Cyanobacteriota/Melainabacteria group bacterium]|nr:Asp-tRNA(Asn)/Glu-tRNA(Gln) amidotransferase subunit GatC [Cyanobacteria bacterium HKST-UBA01]MCB9468475.1 Asp-tRNA(Asn)/Glu-tRNA(Gln) amidotransferase subunit GatC [Candidatus Obscuribacterales bacterium]